MFSAINVPRTGRRLRKGLIAGIAAVLTGALFLPHRRRRVRSSSFIAYRIRLSEISARTPAPSRPLANGGSEVSRGSTSTPGCSASRYIAWTLPTPSIGRETGWSRSTGVTEKAGGRVEVRGEAQGNRFVITSPQGILTTAATVHPAEPCAPDFLQSTTIMRPDTGDLEAVRVSGGAMTSVIIGGAPVAARKYILDGKTRYTVWLDSRNVPIMFVIDDSTGEATFTLAKCVSCDPVVSRLGMN